MSLIGDPNVRLSAQNERTRGRTLVVVEIYSGGSARERSETGTGAMVGCAASCLAVFLQFRNTALARLSNPATRVLQMASPSHGHSPRGRSMQVGKRPFPLYLLWRTFTIALFYFRRTNTTFFSFSFSASTKQFTHFTTSSLSFRLQYEILFFPRSCAPSICGYCGRYSVQSR